MNKLILALALACPVLANAQTLTVDSYNWEPGRKLSALTESQKKQPSVILYNGITLECDYTNADQNELKNVELVHRIIRLNSPEEVESYNKVYIGIDQGEELLEIKARAISPNGKVTELNKSNIKEIKDEQNVNYKIFAIEGAEPGGEVEYLYKVNRHFSRNGYYKVPGGSWVEKAEYKIITPANLVMELKPYNFAMQLSDTVANEKRTVRAVATQVPAAVEEAFANATASQPRLEYKLAYNKARNNARLYTWNDASQNIFQNVFVADPKEKKMIASAYKPLKIKASASDREKILTIDNYIRKNFRISKEINLFRTADILKHKAASELGIMRLYAAFFNLAGVEFEVVNTTNRFERKFDPDFDSWGYLNEHFFFFPKLNKYLSPTDYSMPFGPAPFYVTHNHALFVKKVSVGEFESGLGEVKYIQPQPSKYTSDNLDIKVEFIEDMQKTRVNISKSITGFYATSSLAVLPFLDADKKEELKKALVENIAEAGKFESIVLSNTVDHPMPDTVHTITATVSTPEFLESAGNRTLFKVGELIGPQSELYSENSRQLPIENSFNRQYNRKITFTIPAGYVLKNPEALKMNVNCVKDGQKVFVFESDYTQKGNTYEVNVHEAYERIDYPKENYEEFRKVINAAADFNKITLILEPKG